MTRRSNLLTPANRSAFYLLAILVLSLSFPYAVNAQTPPSPPSSITATATSVTKVSLAWSAAIAGDLPLSSYHVYKGSSPDNMVQCATTTKTSYVDQSASAGTTEYYGVKAADTHGNLSQMSPLASLTVPTPPSPPASVTATSTSTTKVSLSWTAAASGGLPIANYRVFKGSSPSGMAQVAITTKLTYTDTAVTSGSTYYYGVEAADTGGDVSAMSAPAQVTVLSAPSAPATVAAAPTSTSKVSVSWSAAVSGGLAIQNYRVFKGSSPSSLTQLAITTKLSYNDTAVSAGATYYYAVKASDTAGDLSPMSTVVQVTVFMPPSPPGGLTATPTGATKVSLTWSAAASGGLPIQYYQVYRGTSASNLTKLATVTQISYTDKSISAGTTYYYGVMAQDTAADLSSMSAIVSSAGLSGPGAPPNVAATPLSTTKVSLTWSAAPTGGLPIQYYQVYRGSSPASLVKLATVTQTSYTDQSVSSNTTYYYGVESQDSGGDLSPMSAVAAVTLPLPPSPPANVTPTATSTTMVSLTWSTAASGGLPVQYYAVFRGTTPANLSRVGTATQPSYMDTTVTAKTSYYYGVEAEDSGMDYSSMSAVAAVTVPSAPAAPTGVVAAPASATRVTLTWSPAASGGLPVQYYQVYRGNSPTALSLLVTVTQTCFTDSTLSPGNTYYYGVVAEDSGADLSPQSAVASVTMYTMPAAPAGLAASAASSILPGAPQATYSITLSWSASVTGGLPILCYQVYRGSSRSNMTQVAGVSQTSFTDNAVSAGTAYYYAIIAADTGGDLSPMTDPVVATTAGGQTSGLFNILPMNINSFTPTTDNLPGLPTVETAAGPTASLGYQEGKVINGKAIYFPWQVPNGGSTWVSDISNGIGHSVILSYDATQGINGFANAANWTYFDLTTLPWYSKGSIQPGNQLPNLPAGFQGGAVQGNMVYPAPKAGSGEPYGGAGPYPVFIQYNSTKALNDPAAYQTFVPPPETSQVMGYTYGWCNAVSDGRFIYYAPLSNALTGNSGNIFRYDTTRPFSNLATGGMTSAWANFDMHQAPGFNPGGLDPNAEGFQAVVYDGNRYIYFIPFNALLIVRYDTWNGGVAPDPTGFTNVANYVTFDPTRLGTSGFPTVAGQGNTANLAGFTGATVVWDANNQNEYLYLVPWGTYPNNAQNPTLQSTVARVRIGTMTQSGWNPVDITSTAADPDPSAPDWEMYDLSLLTQNPAWPTNWPVLQLNPTFSDQSAIAGWQAAFVTTNDSTGTTFPPRVGFVPDTSEFLVEHDVGHDLYDPTGWYVSNIPITYNYGTMGGGYDPASATLFPASPNVPFFAFQF